MLDKRTISTALCSIDASSRQKFSEHQILKIINHIIPAEKEWNIPRSTNKNSMKSIKTWPSIAPRRRAPTQKTLLLFYLLQDSGWGINFSPFFSCSLEIADFFLLLWQSTRRTINCPTHFWSATVNFQSIKATSPIVPSPVINPRKSSPTHYSAHKKKKK
jgi:hypothetical protein